MNPPNPFGSPQGGAFQAPSSSSKPGMFQTLGQQSSGSQGQSLGFFQPSAFGQPPVINQPAAQGSSIFGQPSISQASSFGQPSLGMTGSGFLSSTAPAFGQTQTAVFGQTSGPNQTSSFGQTSGQNQTSIFGQNQTAVFGQTSGQTQTAVFGQTSGQTQTAVFGQTSGQTQALAFGQTSGQTQTQAFGQTSGQTQTQAFGQTSGQTQTSAFGQTSGQAQTAVFGQPSRQTQTAVFGQTSGKNQTSILVQSSAQNQNPAFGMTPVFGQPPPFGQGSGRGKQPPPFRSSQVATKSTSSFGQAPFGQQSSTSIFGSTQNVTTQNVSTQNRTSEFCFKPSNEALFKPIFNAVSEPAKPQTTAVPSSSFGGIRSQSSSSTSTTSSFSLLAGAQSGPSGFSFLQPSTAASVSAQNNHPAMTSSSTGTSAPQFTFSQPAAPSSSNASSSFKFTAETLQAQPPLFSGGASFGQPPAFGDSTGKEETGTEKKGSSQEDTNVFARLGKASKRKEDPATSGSGLENLTAEEEAPPEADSPRHPSKRPLIRSRGLPGNLFSRALTGICKERASTARQDAVTQNQASNLEETVKRAEMSATLPTAQTLTREVLERSEGSDSGVTPSPKSQVPTPAVTPVSRGARRDSLDSLSGVSPSDLATIMCRNVPHALNKKDVMEKHFARFGKVLRVFCRPAKNMAIVHFGDHASAAKAKKKGKLLHRHELLLLWQKKKQSPGEKGGRPAGQQEKTEGQSPEVKESKAAVSSPLRRPMLMPPSFSSSGSLSHSSPVKKPFPVKLLQFDSEPQKENIAESQSSERPVPSSLVPLIGQVAETTEDKYRLLEQRDKILRQGRPKRTDLDMSKVFVGTCPDMCPEKERYMRETRNQLSVFEVIPNTEMVDHAAAIKEYSRSSADQEEPLPHELRPLPVLSMTMDYLVTQILDQVQDNYRDWYDFVWNRTRGIRKDITQQRLCCPHTVSLIEKCTRFHVHCAHHLCEESMSSFDAKINNENMTKCLQSLKEMYEDLVTQQVFCPHEAEFRQYNVLLKLNDGDILREVQQFREEVRNSPEVKFAVQAFAAVNSNNFVRFFKLVKRASYLASCLLHRYFNQVRAMALKALNMAHTVGPRSTLFPVEDIVRMLMLRNATEASDFVQQYGLNVNDGMVELSRVAFQEPDLPLSQKKSDVILAKKMVLVGQVVNGGPLPNPPQHIPTCSFDSQNKYRGSGPMAEPSLSSDKGVSVELTAPLDIEPSPQFVPVKPPDVPSAFELPPAVTDETGELYPPAVKLFQPEPVKPPSPPPKPQPAYSDEDIVAELDSVIEEVVKVEVKDVADAAASYAAAALAESDVQVESLVREVLGQMLQEISSSEVKLEQERVAEEKRRLEEARRRQEREAFLAQFSCSLCTEIIHQVVDETIQDTATAEIQAARNEKAERLAKCTEQICCGLIEETLSTEISLLVEGLLETELERMHKYIKRWRDVVAVRRKLKRQMRGFPAAPCCVDPRFRLKALAPSAPTPPSGADLARGLINLGNAGVLAVSSTRLLRMREGAVHQMRVHYFYQQLLEETVWAPLDLPALVTENIPNPPDRIFWKTLLLLPSDHESVASLADRLLSDWLEVKLGADGGPEEEQQPGGTMRTLCVTNVLQENRQRTHKVHITIKATRGPLTEPGLSKVEELSELQGTGALVLLLPAPPVVGCGQEEQDVPLLSALLQLKQLQQLNSWHCPLPLVVLVPGCWGAAGTQKLEEALMLHTLLKEELISEYSFFFVPETTNDLQGSKQLTQAMRWLLARAPPPFPLSCQTLLQLIEAGLSREFCPRVYTNRQDRAAALLPPQDPGPVIQLYNAVLDHVADAVASRDLCGLSWPPAEFVLPETRDFVPHLGWNCSEHLARLREAVLSLHLSEWEELPAAGSWSDLCASIFRYAAKIPVSRRSRPLLVSQLDNLLERVRLKAEQSPAFSQVPWDDVVLIFIDHKLRDWQLPGPPVCKDAVTEDGDVLVYFPAGSLKGFRPPDTWTQAIEQTHREKQQESNGAADGACSRSPSLRLGRRLFHGPEDAAEASTPQLDITHSPTAEELLAHRVLQNLEEEKAESRRCTEQLQRWLDGDPLDHLSASLFVPSSTLLSTRTTVQRAPSDRTPEAPPTQCEPDERWDGAAWSKSPRVSLTRRLKDLQQQISASREEELACSLKLRALLSIVDD
ncbi:germinal-center associated nuclear protein isoform X2 [Kryptolebias marmoratus]|uniref:germinal-center associated nuclear protein isoform X2 n=1 Tax=Kryptolebias marmoratus TaxID=37003 RepID=UPI0007F8A2F3|nr:germinal-center associated nuclear protein isoform X2 [Kryptolebias marmoratus]